MKHLILPIAIVLTGTGSGAKAAYVDLTTFGRFTGTNSAISVEENLATLSGTARLSGQVSNLHSFEWRFGAGDVFVENYIDDYAYHFTTTEGFQFLSHVGGVGDYSSTNWMTYTFSAPYSGSITFGVANGFDDESPSILAIRNVAYDVAVSPIPEPGTYAMLALGLGVMTPFMHRRRRGQTLRLETSPAAL
ncbi:PEP-CTERM sorting domain-containing protein [Xylophilus sp. GOD-11R]|uniref:PEP-CTERM sorting domain-containing protein n=1 Tax=Xylophilus sp. GOD-11R TaxID=3089814 RepID=UPI00298BF030|nr:PEP-CTERM sorting domain-containing protein [Xylophilus sp. GOD-11R]WPB56954.1 PEP-CTERM sorting domain-containing protein [Xylophilus sp. GOD-11R]